MHRSQGLVSALLRCSCVCVLYRCKAEATGVTHSNSSSPSRTPLRFRPLVCERQLADDLLADDLVGKAMIAELQADGVDTSHIIVGKGGMSPSTYIIVDQQTNTRTCIHTPGSPPLLPSELSAAALTSLLAGASLAYFDGRLADTTIRICQQAVDMGLPVLVDAEKPREGLDDLLAHATWGGDIVESASEAPSEDVDKALQWVIRAAQEKGSKQGNPAVFSSRPLRLKSSAQGTEVAAQLVAATAVPLEAGQVVDTTGAGDAFIGAVLYAISAGFTVDRMLILGATIAAAKCQALGARQGLPRRDDPRLAHLLEPELAVASGL
ncbi:unnamed protein product [Closterium sp. Naga37s-1]|nr:unnamed protein product [Closterium sp. Naga37s-1]